MKKFTEFFKLNESREIETFSKTYTEVADDIILRCQAGFKNISSEKEGENLYVYSGNKHIGSLIKSKTGIFNLSTDVSINDFKRMIYLKEDVEISIGKAFLDVFKEKFPTLDFNKAETNLTQEWISNYNDSLDKDKTLNQYKEYLCGDDFQSLDVNESHIEPIEKRIRKSSDEYDINTLEEWFDKNIKHKSTYVIHSSGLGGRETSGAKFKREDVYAAIETFPGITAKELKTIFGEDNWKNCYMKVNDLLTKGQIVKTEEFATKGRTKFTYFTANDFSSFNEYREKNKIGKIKLTESEDLDLDLINEEKKLLSSAYMKIIKPLITELQNLPYSDDPKITLLSIIEELQKLQNKI